MTAIAVVAALTAAFTFGLSSVLMFRAASATSAADLLHLRLLARLRRSRLWVLGAGLQAVSFGVQAVALAFGPLALVQPLAGTDLLFAFPLLAHYRRRRLRAVELAGGLLVAVGVGVFLGVSPPTKGIAIPAAHDWLIAVVSVTAVVVVGSAAALRATGLARTTLLAVAGSVDFALVDALSKSFVGHLRRDGLPSTLLVWEPYALLAAGTVGLVLSQSAFQSGALQVSLPVIDTLEPTLSVLLGTLVFHESLARSPATLTFQLIGAGVAIIGIVVLDRSPVVSPQPPSGHHTGQDSRR